MIGWIEIALLAGALSLLACGTVPRMHAYRSLLWGGAVLLLITSLFPRPGNGLAEYLFGANAATHPVPIELFGISWWILGAWLLTSLLDLVLRRTIFPHDNQPHARRLFADLAAGLVYVVAFVGIMETVFKQPISTVLATSGVLAIVLGLALQNTLADVFAGLALNIERSFEAGDWITLSDAVEGQLIEINWRATRIKTASNDMIVIPNSVVAKAIVKNHRRLNDAHICTIRVQIDHQVSPQHVIDVLQSAASGTPGLSLGSIPIAYACTFADSFITYEVSVGIDDFTLTPAVQSQVICRISEALNRSGIKIGATATNVRIIRNDSHAMNAAAFLGSTTPKSTATALPSLRNGNTVAPV